MRTPSISVNPTPFSNSVALPSSRLMVSGATSNNTAPRATPRRALATSVSRTTGPVSSADRSTPSVSTSGPRSINLTERSLRTPTTADSNRQLPAGSSPKGVENTLLSSKLKPSTAIRSSRRTDVSSLEIVGPDGNAVSEVTAALAGGNERITRRGFVDDARLRDLFATTRGFVFPSVAEGFGLVVLEAMSAGAPVIAARATSLPEVVGDAGLLVDPDDVADLRTAMERLATDAALFAKLQTAGYARLAAFSWSRAGRQTARVLRSVTA